MPSITFLPDNITVETRENESILDTALRARIPLAHICQGNGRCTTCRIMVVEGAVNLSPPSVDEQKISGQMSFGSEIRLSCQTKIHGDVKVRRLVLDEEDIEVNSLLINEPHSGMIGHEKEVMILFADIRGFTSLTAHLLPYDVVHILNRYFSCMGKVIASYGGRIDNYMGDGFLALFDIEAIEQDMLCGIKAGLGMLDAVARTIGPYVRTYFGRDFRIGIGLHYGLVVAGEIGGLENKKQTIIGDAVNFTSRIEAINKQLGTEFLISEDIYAIVQKKVKVNLIQSVSIAGKTELHTLYEVVGLV